MKGKNIVIFSSGVSEREGILFSLKFKLEKKGHKCLLWRDLFSTSLDISNIALLPMLIKKIPTFDYAILICEGHDKTVIKREHEIVEVKTMRDNVLFEIGLCTMALGVSRVILLTDDNVRLPDDLMGVNNQVALKCIVYTKYYGELIIDEIESYMQEADKVLSPVVLGAASTTALGYLKNFVIRTLVYIENGFVRKDSENKVQSEEKIKFPLSKIYMHVILPQKYDNNSTFNLDNYQPQLQLGHIPDASFRGVDFRYLIKNDTLHIYDYPSSIVTSYDTAKMILDLNADDSKDLYAEERFVQKEINLFCNTIKCLLNEEFISETIYGNFNCVNNKTAIVEKIYNLLKNRFDISFYNK